VADDRHRIQCNEYHKRYDEEQQHQQQEERNAGDGISLCQTHRYKIIHWIILALIGFSAR